MRAEGLVLALLIALAWIRAGVEDWAGPSVCQCGQAPIGYTGATVLTIAVGAFVWWRRHATVPGKE